MHHSFFLQTEKTIDTGLRSARLLKPAGNLYDSASALWPAQWAMVWSGRFDEAARLGKEVWELAVQTRNDAARSLSDHADALRELAVTANLDQFETRAVSQVEFGRTAGVAWVICGYHGLGRAQLWRGRWNEAKETVQEGVKFEVPLATAAYGLCDGCYFLVTAYSGDNNSALAMLHPKRAMLLEGHASTHCLRLLDSVVEGLVVLGEWDEAARYYPLALESVGTGNIIRVSFDGLVQTTAGIAAMAGHQWEKAEEHYQIALRQAHELPHKIEQPEVRRWYARMLIERNAPGDKEKARALLSEAIEMYRAIGMPKHLEMAKELMKNV